MKIKWLQQVELTVVYRYDIYGENADEGLVVVERGEISDVDVLKYKGDDVDIQFAKTSFTLAVPKDYFKLLED